MVVRESPGGRDDILKGKQFLNGSDEDSYNFKLLRDPSSDLTDKTNSLILLGTLPSES